MGIVNTTKNIRRRESQMPETEPDFAPSVDDVEEDEPDRVGNVDPGTNVQPEAECAGPTITELSFKNGVLFMRGQRTDKIEFVVETNAPPALLLNELFDCVISTVERFTL